MDPALRIVTQLPPPELWRADGVAFGPRLRPLAADDVAELLRLETCLFVVAELGEPLR